MGETPFALFSAACSVRNGQYIFAILEKFPKDNCEVSFKPWEKSFMKCMGILTLISCNKTIRKIFPLK
jgi:hypothetical protein